VPRLSILIPHLDSPRIESNRSKRCFDKDSSFESTVLAVLESQPSDSEVIVAHSGSYADPYELDGNELKMVNVGEGAGLAELINSALSQSRGTIVHTLLPGCVVEAGWTDPAMEHFRDSNVSSVSPRLAPNDCKERNCYSLDPNWIPRRAWLNHARSGDAGVASLCGGFYRRSSLLATSGWIGTAEESVARETAEVELAMMFRVLGLHGVCEPDCMVAAPKRVIDGKMGGYALGHDAGRLAVAYAEVSQGFPQPEGLAGRLGHLAGGLVSPKSVAERLGWVVGSTDRSLVADIRWRFARAEMELASRSKSTTVKVAA
jgi:hypothetical protein